MRSTNLLAALIIQHGRIYEYTNICQGTCETGPMAFTYHGYRWGRAYVEIQPNGTVFIGWRVKPELWIDSRGEKHFIDLDVWRMLDYSQVGAATVAHKLLWLRKRSRIEGMEKAYAAR